MLHLHVLFFNKCDHKLICTATLSAVSVISMYTKSLENVWFVICWATKAVLPLTLSGLIKGVGLFMHSCPVTTFICLRGHISSVCDMNNLCPCLSVCAHTLTNIHMHSGVSYSVGPMFVEPDYTRGLFSPCCHNTIKTLLLPSEKSLQQLCSFFFLRCILN